MSRIIGILSLSIAAAMTLSQPVFAREDVTPTSKADTIRYLKDLRDQNVTRLREIDRSLSDKIKSTSSAEFDREITPLRSARREHMLRQEFLDRLIFQIDTRFAGGDLRKFLSERALPAMATADALSAAETGLLKFLKFAGDAVQRLPEQKENILSFLEGYMNRSVANPISPDDYLSSRNYSNGSVSESGSPMGRDKVGELADKRLQELEQQAESEAEVH